MVIMDSLAYNSKIKGASPAIKAGLAISTLLGTLVVGKNLFSLAVLAVSALACTAISGLAVRRYLRLCAVPFGFLLLGMLTIVVNVSVQPQGLWNMPVFGGYIVITQAGIVQALNVFLKSMAGISCLTFLYVSTPVNDLLGLLDRMRTPPLLIELMLMMYRFIFILLGMSSQMTTAQHSRLGSAGFRASMRSLASLASSVFVGAFQKSNQLYDAMESRGYDGTIAFTGELPRAGFKQKLVFALYEALLIISAVAVGSMR